MAAVNASGEGEAPPLHFFDFGSDDESEDTSAADTRALPELRLTDPEQPLAKTPSVLFVSFGPVPTDCLRTRLQLDAAVAMADIATAKSGVDGIANETSSPICQKGSATVCVGATGIAGADGPTWATQLLAAVPEPKFVAILTEQALFKFRASSAHDQGEVVARMLATSTAPALPKEGATLVLDPPNFVDGAAAALLSKCQVRGIPARVYVSYRAHGGTDKDVDSSSFVAFDSVFRDPSVTSTDIEIMGDEAAHKTYQTFVRTAWKKTSNSLMYL